MVLGQFQNMVGCWSFKVSKEFWTIKWRFHVKIVRYYVYWQLFPKMGDLKNFWGLYYKTFYGSNNCCIVIS
jgi:hypothetical protein